MKQIAIPFPCNLHGLWFPPLIFAPSTSSFCIAVHLKYKNSCAQPNIQILPLPAPHSPTDIEETDAAERPPILSIYSLDLFLLLINGVVPLLLS